MFEFYSCYRLVLENLHLDFVKLCDAVWSRACSGNSLELT